MDNSNTLWLFYECQFLPQVGYRNCKFRKLLKVCLLHDSSFFLFFRAAIWASEGWVTEVSPMIPVMARFYLCSGDVLQTISVLLYDFFCPCALNILRSLLTVADYTTDHEFDPLGGF